MRWWWEREKKMCWVSTNIHVGRLSGLENKLVCSFKLAIDMVMDVIWEFVKYADGSAFL